MKYKNIRDKVKSILFEDVSPVDIHQNVGYGVFDKPSNSKDADAEFESTIQPELPLAPTEMMAHQLVDERPPIEDDEYAPTNVEELARAATALAKLVPSDGVEKFYIDMRRLADDARSDVEQAEVALGSDPIATSTRKKEDVKQEAKQTIVSSIRKILEQIDLDPEELDLYRHGSKRASDEIDWMGDEEDALPAPTGLNTQGDKAVLTKMAPALGYGAASGVRQAINRALGKAGYLVNMITEQDLATLQQYAVGVYVKALEASKLIDAEDANELASMPQHVQELDSFRVFLSNHLVAPALRELEKAADKRIRKELVDMDVPDVSRLHDTIVNQVTGASRTKQSRILDKLSGAKGIDVKSTVKNLQNAMPKLKKLAALEGGLPGMAISRWESMSSKKQQGVVKKSLETSVQDQETIEKLDQLTDEN